MTKSRKSGLTCHPKIAGGTESESSLILFASGPQCKKHYENLRTRVGKIIKKEKRSETGQLWRSSRDDQIMESWSFLTPHIVRGETVPREQITGPKSAAHWEQSRPPIIERVPTTADTAITHSDLRDAVQQVRISMATYSW